LYILATAKSSLLREGLHADERQFLLNYWRLVPPHIAMTLLVPRLYRLTCNLNLYNIEQNINTNSIYTNVGPNDDGFGDIVPIKTYNNNNNNINDINTFNSGIINHQTRTRVHLPQSLSLSVESLSAEHIYLMDDTICIYIWVGHLIPQSLRVLLFDSVSQPSFTSTGLIIHHGKPETVTILKERPNQPPYTLPPTQQSQQDTFNPYVYYAHNLLHKIHNIIDYLRTDKSLHQKIRIINSTSLPRTQATESKNSTILRSIDEISFARKLVEDISALPQRGYSSDSQTFSISLPTGKTVTIPPANTVITSQRSCVMSYVDYLVWAHKSIGAKLAQDR
jgi:hypothetical protein